jgi:hypothetical protein
LTFTPFSPHLSQHGTHAPGQQMQHDSLTAYIASLRATPARGPVAVICVEDTAEVDGTLNHHLRAGFRDVLMLAPEGIDPSPEVLPRIHLIRYDVYAQDALPNAVNALIAAMPGTWIYYGFNAEYLFFPFCETRNVREMIAFQMEERRDAFLSYVIDLYAGDLGSYPDAVAPGDALLDRSGYYALGRPDPGNHNHPKERQLDFFGGLRWRFEEHVPMVRRKIDRIALFRARAGLTLRDDFTFSDEEYNTYACPWHNNITTAVMSFRTAKALRSNPGSKYAIRDFRWRNSTPFQWNSQQLMDLGLMEPGQWF